MDDLVCVSQISIGYWVMYNCRHTYVSSGITTLHYCYWADMITRNEPTTDTDIQVYTKGEHR